MVITVRTVLKMPFRKVALSMPFDYPAPLLMPVQPHLLERNSI